MCHQYRIKKIEIGADLSKTADEIMRKYIYNKADR